MSQPSEEFDESLASRQPRAARQSNGLAIASVILSVCGLTCLPIFGSLVGLILGIIALMRANRRKSGNGLASVGMALGGVGLMVGPLLVALLLPAVQKVREAANKMRSARNEQQLVIAMHQYHNDYNHLPKAALTDKNGRPLLSWRVAVLPYLGPEATALYREFHLDEPWDSPHNAALIPRMPKVFLDPRMPAASGQTAYQVFVGPGSAFDPATTMSLAKLDGGDGTAHTVLIVEAAEPVPWTKPQDLPYDPQQPLPPLFRQPRSFVVAFADASTRSVKRDVPDNVLRAFITWNGGEVVDASPYLE